MYNWHSQLKAHREKLSRMALELVTREQDSRELYHLTTALGAAIDEIVKQRSELETVRKFIMDHIERELIEAQRLDQAATPHDQR